VSGVWIVDELLVDAPIDVLWRAIEDPAEHGAGTRCCVLSKVGTSCTGSCTVPVGRGHGTTRERCVERQEGARIVWAVEEDSTGFGRMVSDWRSGFSLAERDARRSSPRRARSGPTTCWSGRCCR
jgi:hypothetical protein